MTRCSEYRPKLLEYRYGLLDAAEVAAVRAHLGDCRACAAAWAESGRQQKLIARAAKGVGPTVTFAAPAATTPVTPSRTATPVRASVLGWAAVAAGLLLAVGVVGVSAARDVTAAARAKPAVARELARFEAARAERDKARAEATAADREYAVARKAHDELVAEWSAAEQAARDRVAARPDFRVRGPAVPVSGAPNEYLVSVAGPAGQPYSDGFEAAVKDDAGRVVHTQTFQPGESSKPSSFRLPPKAWENVKPGSDLFLHVSAVNAATGARADLADPVRLAGPAYTTFLTTDKPAYRPGETVYFRSLTLDRTRFLPPAKDSELRYELRSSSGQVVPGCELTGLARPSAAGRDGNLAPVIGPDGKPVRGVGTGAFALPADIDGGEYTLAVSAARQVPGAKPLAVRKVAVFKQTATRPTALPVPAAAKQLMLEFFPEGGDLVAGVPNRVYVRASTVAGRPADVTGVVADGTGEVCRFHTHTDPDHPETNRGLGEFTFTPVSGKKYSARLDHPDAPPAGFTLPIVKPEGVVLSVADGVTGPGQPIRLTLSSAGAKRSLWVGAYVRGVPVAHARTAVEPGQPTDVVLRPTDDKLGGVTRITVFEESTNGPDKPVAERLVFRRPGEVLKLGVNATPTDGGSLAPGGTVRLDVTAATEADAPTPAVLWAAVVHHGVATSGSPASRSLPAHFYLAGEVRSPNELEHADFLLTDHPAAGKSLDLLLGTQGWRRFAEQSPDQFRRKSPADADHLFATAGTVPVSLGGADIGRTVFDEFWPKYDVAHARLAEVRQRVTRLTPPEAVESEYAAARSAFLSATSELEGVTNPGRRAWRIAVAVGLLLTALGLVVFVRGRGPTLAGAIGCVVLAGGVALASLMTRPTDHGWRETARTAAVAEPPVPVRALPSAELPPLPEPPKSKEFVAKPDPAKMMKPMTAGVSTLRVGPVSLPDGVGTPPPSARFRNEPTTAPAFRWSPEFAELAKSPSAAEFCRRVVELAHTTVPRTAPLVVREYAHARSADGTPQYAETLLWQPVLVVPVSGSASLTFALGDAETPYQVLVAGHTLDGRLGAVTSRIEARKPGRP